MGKEWEDRLSDHEIRNFMLNMMNDLKREILGEIKAMLKPAETPNLRKWIKSVDVKKLLNISHGKLQTMRNSRAISFTRVGGTLYYNLEDIHRMLEQNKKK